SCSQLPTLSGSPSGSRALPQSAHCMSLRALPYSYGAPRDLHSFPTRRSSDLVSAARAASTARSTSSSPAMAALPSGSPEAGSKRSEEHTSELQSHLKLVCRLLLEKKKKAGATLWSSGGCGGEASGFCRAAGRR